MQVCYLELQHQLLIIIYINLSQTRTDGTINSLDNAKNNSLNYGVNLDWTVLTALKCSQN
jgi:hypothetical protein